MKDVKARSKTRKEVEQSFPEMHTKQNLRNKLAFDQLKQMQGQFFQGVDPRRRQEMADAGMISEDPYAMANCPTRAIHAEMLPIQFFTNQYIDSLVEVQE